MIEIKPDGMPKSILHEDPYEYPEITDEYGITRRNGKVVRIEPTKMYPDRVVVQVKSVKDLKQGDTLKLISVSKFMSISVFNSDYYEIRGERYIRIHGSEIPLFSRGQLTVGKVFAKGDIVVPEKPVDSGKMVWDDRTTGVYGKYRGYGEANIYSGQEPSLRGLYELRASRDFAYTLERARTIPYSPHHESFEGHQVPMVITDEWIKYGLVESVTRYPEISREELRAVREARQELQTYMKTGARQ